MSERGGWAPPQITWRRSGNSKSPADNTSATASHTVGTPRVMVTSSEAKRSTTLAASSAPAANTCLAPTRVEAYGAPQALAWYIGTIGRTESVGPIENTAPDVVISAWMKVERCVYS